MEYTITSEMKQLISLSPIPVDSNFWGAEKIVSIGQKGGPPVKGQIFFYENMPKKPYRRGEKGASPNWPSTHKCPPDRKKKVPVSKIKGWWRRFFNLDLPKNLKII